MPVPFYWAQFLHFCLLHWVSSVITVYDWAKSDRWEKPDRCIKKWITSVYYSEWVSFIYHCTNLWLGEKKPNFFADLMKESNI